MNRLLTALERQSLSRKLAIGFALLVMGTIAISIEGLVSQHDVISDLKVLHDKELQGVASGKDAQVSYATIGRTLRQALIAPDTVERSRSLSQLDAARVALSMEITLLRTTLFREDTRKLLILFEK